MANCSYCCSSKPTRRKIKNIFNILGNCLIWFFKIVSKRQVSVSCLCVQIWSPDVEAGGNTQTWDTDINLNISLSEKQMFYFPKYWTFNLTHCLLFTNFLHSSFFEDNLALWFTMLKKLIKPHYSSSGVQVCHQYEASSQPLEVRRDRCWTEESGGNSLCPGVRRCVSVRGTERCEREPAAAGWSDLESRCPSSPTRQHSNCSTFIPLCYIWTTAFVVLTIIFISFTVHFQPLRLIFRDVIYFVG